jgi:hypothetical protein
MRLEAVRFFSVKLERAWFRMLNASWNFEEQWS